MRITKITVTASRTWPDPFKNFANIRPELTLEAEIGDDEFIGD
jgi:hypothetical protein